MHLLKHRSMVFYLGFVLILSMAIGGVAIGAFAAPPCSSTDVTGTTCGTSTTTASATIVPGTLSESAASTATASAVTLDGTDKSTSYAFAISVIDARGTGAGWNLTMQTSQFQTSGSPTYSLNSNASTLSGVLTACVASTTCSASSGAVQNTGSNLSSATKIWSAGAGAGMGSYTVTPTVNVAIPADTYAGTYTSNVTVDLIAGP